MNCLPPQLPRPRSLAGALATMAAVMVWAAASSIAAQPAAPPGSAVPTGPSATAATRLTSSPAPTPSPGDGASLPPDHPPTGPAGPAPELPPGHPDISGRGTVGSPLGMPRRPPPDRIVVDDELPAGTIAVEILDADEQPLPNIALTLDVLQRSVARGDSSQQQTATADEGGQFRFTDLEFGRGISYRVTAHRSAARFASEPFGLSDQHGVRVQLHAFEPTNRPEEARVDVGAIVVLELEDDAIAVQHVLRILVVGPKAWVPTNVAMPLPADHQAFRGPEAMAQAGVRQAADRVELVGTFPPGSTELSYGFRIPLGSATSKSLALALPPRVSRARVVVSAAPQMTLQVEGFPAAQAARGPEGKRVLFTERQLALGGRGLDTLQISLEGLPGPNEARWIALVLAIVAAMAGMSTAWSARQRDEQRDRLQREDLAEARSVLLEEVRALESARQRGEMAPSGYRSVRAALVAALERIVSRQQKLTPKSRRKKHAS